MPVCVRAGTFILTDEPVLEPPRLLATAMDAKRLPPDAFFTMTHGETRVLPSGPGPIPLPLPTPPVAAASEAPPEEKA